jgi:hypothetical protein
VAEEAIMSDENCMVYVAECAEYPGTACALVIDEPSRKKETSKTLTAWLRRGDNVLRVDLEAGKKMLRAYLDARGTKS